MGSDNNGKEVSTTTTVVGPNYLMITSIGLVMLAIGTGIGLLTIQFGNQNKVLLDTKIENLGKDDLQWLYLAIVMLSRMVGIVNFAPMGYKNDLKGNMRSNPFFYETQDDNKTLVIFKQDGKEGCYNRSNRSVQHMIENIGPLLAAIGPVGYVFPKQTFYAVTVFSAGRILHQMGYSKGYGSHGPGFLLSTLSMLTIEGLSLLVFLKASKIIS